MKIQSDRNGRRFLLTAGEMSYALELDAEDHPVNLYWGGKLERMEDLPSLDDRRRNRHRSPRQSDMVCQEYPAFYGEFYDECALKITWPDGIRATRFRFLEGVREKDCLILSFEEERHALTLKLFYRLLPDLNLMERWSEIRNATGSGVLLENYASAAWQMPGTVADWRLTHLAGRWGREAKPERLMVTQGKFVLESRTGLSGPFHVPFFALDDGSADELSGEVFFGAVEWSGNWKITIDRDAFDHTAVVGGINDFDSRPVLEDGETFRTPVFCGGWSEEGFSGMSRILHRYQLHHLLPKEIAGKPMPVVFNSWGSINIHVNEENILGAARKAQRIGAELFVIDDGWQTFLGDWTPDPEKFPNGLKPVIEEVRKLGMELGLWVEPESFELKSELYRKHPEWAMAYPGCPPFRKRRDDVDRDSVMLNLARRDVAEYLYTSLHTLVAETGIRYLKLDMNCFVSSPGWGDRPGWFWIDYVRNLHWIFETLSSDFSGLLMENCAAGAGRADLSMQRCFGRMNRSDNQDALDMVKLHENFSYVNHPRLAGGACHISDSMFGINLRRTPMKFQAYCGMLGSLACGKDLMHCSEEELDEIRSYTDLYKKIRHVTNFGDFYRLVSNYTHPYAVYEYLLPDRTEAVVFVLGASIQFSDKIPPIRVPGLLPDAVYAVTCYGNRVQTNDYSASVREYRDLSGRGAANAGIRVELLGDYDCRILHFQLRKGVPAPSGK